MMKLLLIGIFLTELIKYGLWFKGIHELRFARWHLGSVVAGIYLLFICIGLINEDSLLIFWSLAVVIIFSIMIECDKGERGLFIVQTVFAVTSIGEVVGGVIQMINNVLVTKLSKSTYLLSNVITMIIFFVLNRVIKWIKFSKIMKSGKLYRNVVYGAIALMGVVILLVITGFQSIAKFVEDDRLHTFSRIISIVAYICIVCLVMVVCYIFNENKRYKIYLEKEAMLVRLQKNTYEAMLLKNEETKCFRHDMQNHFICLNELAKRGEIIKVQNYISEIAGRFHAIQGKIFSVGNSVVDGVLNYYISMLPADVKVNIEGVCASNIKISDFELCTIVSNLIQNAEEALKKEGTENRFLQIEFGNIEGYTLMKMKNSIAENSVILEKNSIIPKTTKQNVENHGMGMRNIKDTLERNGGVLDIEVSRNEFSVMIMLPVEVSVHQ